MSVNSRPAWFRKWVLGQPGKTKNERIKEKEKSKEIKEGKKGKEENKYL